MLKAKDIMNKRFNTISEDTDVKKICALLTKYQVSGLPVVDDKGALRGFVSERDIIASVPKPHFLKKTAKDIMTRKVITVTEDAYAEKVSKIFTDKPYRIIPVVRKGVIAGVISRKEVIHRLLGQYY